MLGYRVRRPQRLGWVDGPMTSYHLALGAAGLLLAIGLIMVFSASAIEAALADDPAWAPGLKQLALAGVGLVGMWLALRLPTGFLRRWSPVALLAVAGLLVLVLVPGVGVRLNGARQWFDLGVATLQPSEIAKLVFALWGAHILALRDRHLTVRPLLLPLVPVFIALSLLLLLEPDFGAAASLGLVLVGLLWAGSAPWRTWAGFAVLAAAAAAALVFLAPYRMARITAFLDPFADPTDGGFQAIRGFYALARGGLGGVGLGNSAEKWNLLPEAESDYIFAIIGEELGFLGCLVVVTLYGVLAYTGVRIASRAADRFIQLASVAITTWLVGQATMNMGYVVGLLPVTGVTLPLVSAGGTSLVLTLFAVGLLARFARCEPAAIEHARRQERSRLARWLFPVPAQAIEPVNLRRRSPGVSAAPAAAYVRRSAGPRTARTDGLPWRPPAGSRDTPRLVVRGPRTRGHAKTASPPDAASPSPRNSPIRSAAENRGRAERGAKHVLG